MAGTRFGSPRLRRLVNPPRTLVGQAVLVAGAFLILEAIYALTAGQVAYQAAVLTQVIPLKQLVLEQWGEGTLPLWSSVLGTGQPLFADSTSLPLDWRNLLFLPISTLNGYIAAAIVTRILGAVITFAYLRRRLGVSGLPAFLGALVFLSSTSLIGEGTTLYTGIVFFPGLVWLSERLLEAIDPVRILALGSAWALFFLMNSLQYVPYLVVGAFAWCLIYARFREGILDRRLVLRFAGAFVAAGAVGGALAAVTLLPTLELSSASNRGGEYPSEQYALHSLISAVIGTTESSGRLPGGAYYFYIGIISFAPIAVAIRRRANPYVRTAVALGVGIAVLLLAGFVAKSWLVDILPDLATLSIARPAFLIGFAAAVLVSYGFAEPDWRFGPRTRLALIAILVAQASVLIVVLLTVRLGIDVPPLDLHDRLAPVFVGLLPLLLVVVRTLGLGGALVQPLDGFRLRIGQLHLKRTLVVGALLVVELALAWGIHRPMTNQTGYTSTPESRFLKANTGPDLRAMEILPRPGWKDRLPGPPDLSLHQNAPAYAGIPTTNVYSSLISKDYSDTFDDFGETAFRRATYRNAPNSTMVTSRYDSPLIRALGVGYLYSNASLPGAQRSRLVLAGDAYYVYAISNPLPRAFFSGRGRWLSRDLVHRELRRLAKDRPGRVDLGPEILIEGSGGAEGERAYAPATVTSDQGDEVEVTVSAPRPGFLVLSDVNLPGWSAEVDGQPTEIYKANGFARAVRVFAGRHTVRFHYEPPALRRGALLSGTAALLCLALLVATSLVPHARERSRRIR
jgi:hypothetical protein